MNENMYFYHDGQNEVGPLSFSNLQKIFDAGVISKETLCRHQNSDKWIKFKNIREEINEKIKFNSSAKAKEVVTNKNTEEEMSHPRSNMDDKDQSTPNLGPYAENKYPKSEIFELDNETWSTKLKAPWRRWAARLLDIYLNGSVMMFIFGTLFYIISPYAANDFFNLISSPGGRILDIILTSFASLILGAFMIGIFGTTIGKLIFGIKIVDGKGKKIGITSGWKRELSVWVTGMAIGIPLISLFTMWSQKNKLEDEGSTSWDANRYVIVYRKSGLSQSVLNFIGILMYFMIAIGMQLLSEL